MAAEMMAERIEQVWKFADLEFGAVQNDVAVSPSQRRTSNLDRHERLGSVRSALLRFAERGALLGPRTKA